MHFNFRGKSPIDSCSIDCFLLHDAPDIGPYDFIWGIYDIPIPPLTPHYMPCFFSLLIKFTFPIRKYLHKLPALC